MRSNARPRAGPSPPAPPLGQGPHMRRRRPRGHTRPSPSPSASSGGTTGAWPHGFDEAHEVLQLAPEARRAGARGGGRSAALSCRRGEGGVGEGGGRVRGEEAWTTRAGAGRASSSASAVAEGAGAGAGRRVHVDKGREQGCGSLRRRQSASIGMV